MKELFLAAILTAYVGYLGLLHRSEPKPKYNLSQEVELMTPDHQGHSAIVRDTH